jgi:hypothetical protein
MKFATIVTLGILLLASSALLSAQPGASSQVVLAYMNEPTTPPTPLPGFDGLCLVYYTMIGDLDLKSLFAGPLFGNPVIDRAHANFIWVSDYKAIPLAANKEFTSFSIVEGTATIYYTDRPDLRDWNNRSTWGEPVATYVRKAGMFVSRDGGFSGTFASTAELVSSKPFKVNGKNFNFKDLAPNGITCFETAAGDYEAGSCISVGK